MNKEWKDKWLTALRSGEYLRGKGRLKYIGITSANDRYCCLGVLCELYKKETGRVKWINGGRDLEITSMLEDHSKYHSYIPDEIIDDLNLLDLKEMEVLVKMNDSLNKSFVEIADYIEQNL